MGFWGKLLGGIAKAGETVNEVTALSLEVQALDTRIRQLNGVLITPDVYADLVVRIQKITALANEVRR